jgi:hydroxymethylpyrimidine pyrophosphatase-like HAD family hydrolase
LVSGRDSSSATTAAGHLTGTLIVADVDGTLVDGAGVPYAGALEFAARVQRAGGALALASARPPWSVARIAAWLGSSVTALVGFQGAIGQRRDGGSRWCTLWSTPLHDEVVCGLDRRLDPALARWWYTADRWTISRVDDAARSEAAIVDAAWDAIETRPPTAAVLKLLAVGDPELVTRAAEVTIPGAASAISKPVYLEIVSDAVDRDKGLARLRAGLDGIRRTVALGDGPNDMGMLTAADLGCTFGDAPEDVRAVATVVLSPDRPTGYEELFRRLERAR